MRRTLYRWVIIAAVAAATLVATWYLRWDGTLNRTAHSDTERPFLSDPRGVVGVDSGETNPGQLKHPSKEVKPTQVSSARKAFPEVDAAVARLREDLKGIEKSNTEVVQEADDGPREVTVVRVSQPNAEQLDIAHNAATRVLDSFPDGSPEEIEARMQVQEALREFIGFKKPIKALIVSRNKVTGTGRLMEFYVDRMEDMMMRPPFGWKIVHDST